MLLEDKEFKPLRQSLRDTRCTRITRSEMDISGQEPIDGANASTKKNNTGQTGEKGFGFKSL